MNITVGLDQSSEARLQLGRIAHRLRHSWKNLLFEQLAAFNERLSHHIATGKYEHIEYIEAQWRAG